LKSIFPFLLLAGVLAAAPGAPAQPKPIAGQELPVSVSSANYELTPTEELVRYANERDVVDPDKPITTVIKERRSYIFMPGEIYVAFPSYGDLCRRLAPALAAQGFDNAADAQDRVPKALKIDLVLRLSYGQREWRVPTVRVRNLQFRDGLVTRPGADRIVSGGAETTFDYFAGGNDEAINAIANTGAGALSNASGAGNFAQNRGPGTMPDSAVRAPGGDATSLTETRNTRDYNILVVDAFDYAELKARGRSAGRKWSTFVALPVQAGSQDFDAIIDRMINTAQPYFGQTTRGIQFYRDVRTKVILHELIILPDEKK
jgi:hypothetical protein